MIAPFGFDNSTWDPSKDKLLPQSYSTDDMRGKDVCKVALQQHLGLRDHTSIVLVSGQSIEDLSPAHPPFFWMLL